MTQLLFYDGAYPRIGGAPLEGVVGVCGYIGGDTPHVWTKEEWAEQPYRYRIPIYVRSDPQLADPVHDAAEAVAALAALDAPKGVAVALDSETAADPAYTRGFYAAIEAHNPVIEYGSRDFVLGNDNPSGWYWVAEPGASSPVPGFLATQYYWGQSYDLDWFDAAWVYDHCWDTKAPPKPKPAPVPANPVSELVLTTGWSTVKASWRGARYAKGYEVKLYSNSLVIDKVITTATSYQFKYALCTRHQLYGLTVRALPSATDARVATANVRTR
jgi:hypothetical protein